MARNGSYFNVTGKVAIVTGGSTGIGRAPALLFARHGAKFVIGDMNPFPRLRHAARADFANPGIVETRFTLLVLAFLSTLPLNKPVL